MKTIELNKTVGVVEIWKDLPNYEGIYCVSTHGRIKSLDRVVVRDAKNILYKGYYWRFKNVN